VVNVGKSSVPSPSLPNSQILDQKANEIRSTIVSGTFDPNLIDPSLHNSQHEDWVSSSQDIPGLATHEEDGNDDVEMEDAESQKTVNSSTRP